MERLSIWSSGSSILKANQRWEPEERILDKRLIDNYFRSPK